MCGQAQSTRWCRHTCLRPPSVACPEAQLPRGARLPLGSNSLDPEPPSDLSLNQGGGSRGAFPRALLPDRAPREGAIGSAGRALGGVLAFTATSYTTGTFFSLK